jgi:prepilin-type N-terminal cleavage/methylation domain-containing protein
MKLKKYATGKAGFSVVELMVVIALIGLLSAIALPSLLSSMSEKRLKNAARNLYADLQKARLLAVKRNTRITVTFNTTARTYSYPISSSETATVRLDDYGGNGKIVSYGQGKATSFWPPYNDTSNYPPSNYPFDSSPVPSTGTIIFEPQGTVFLGFSTSNQKILVPETGANIYLQNQNNDVCYAASVNQFGGIRLRRYNGSAWE